RRMSWGCASAITACRSRRSPTAETLARACRCWRRIAAERSRPGTASRRARRCARPAADKKRADAGGARSLQTTSYFRLRLFPGEVASGEFLFETAFVHAGRAAAAFFGLFFEFRCGRALRFAFWGVFEFHGFEFVRDHESF